MKLDVLLPVPIEVSDDDPRHCGWGCRFHDSEQEYRCVLFLEPSEYDEDWEGVFSDTDSPYLRCPSCIEATKELI